MDEGEGRLASRPNGGVQKVRCRRKIFGRERQRIFLAHLAATCNVKWSADAVGVSVQCVYQRLEFDAAFREAWCRAMGVGYLRLEARLIEEAEKPIEFDAGADGPPVRFDKSLALQLLRDHRMDAGRAGGGGRGARGPAQGVAERRSARWDEVEAWFVRHLGALRTRLDAARGAPTRGGAFGGAARDGD